MSKHTPGPWSLRGYNLETLDFAVSATGQMVDFDIYPPMSKKHMMPIASVQHCFNGKACEANARLIAASPRLLQALKKIVQCEKRRAADLRHRGAWMLVKFSEERVAEAEAAIREAEGT